MLTFLEFLEALAQLRPTNRIIDQLRQLIGTQVVKLKYADESLSGSPESVISGILVQETSHYFGIWDRNIKKGGFVYHAVIRIEGNKIFTCPSAVRD